MGAHQSTRKITIDNDDPTNVIKVSDSVIQRLRGGTRVKSEGEASTPSILNPPIPPPSVSNSAHPLYPRYVYETSNNSLQMRQDKEAALKKNDAYWQERINKLEETHEKINKVMEQEYNEAMKEMHGQFSGTTGELRKEACQEGKAKVMECYKKYPNEPMRCAREVQAFTECVDKHRSELVANRG